MKSKLYRKILNTTSTMTNKSMTHFFCKLQTTLSTMTAEIWSRSNTPIVWVARKVNDFLKDTVHSDNSVLVIFTCNSEEVLWFITHKERVFKI